MSESVHKSVLLHEVVTSFKEWEAGRKKKEVGTSPIFLDGTLGGAGHSLAIAQTCGGKLTLIGLDRDEQAIERAQKTLQGKAEKLILEVADYRNLAETLGTHGIPAIDFILLDLGISSDELDTSGRGFSFLREEPLLMTMGDPVSYPFTVETLVNTWAEEDIANVIFAYGEERFARRIARAIVGYRQKSPIRTTTELAEIIKQSVPAFYRRARLHPATKTFQALRIVVNDELAALRKGLEEGFKALAESGMIAVISFHSLEDRIVKEFFRTKAAEKQAIVLTKKPITPGLQEVGENPRSRSAKLRILVKETVKRTS